MLNLEKKSVESSLQQAEDFINDNYGYTATEESVDIAYVKNKGDYDDLEEAKNLSIGGLRTYEIGKENADVNKAIAIWEKALTESDINDKRARIDKKVTEDLLFNLLKVYLITYQIDKADEKYNKLRTMDLSMFDKPELEKLEKILSDKKVRAKANGLHG